VAASLFVHLLRQRHDRHMTSSCANHAIQLEFLVRSFVEKEGCFPSESDARSALAKMSHPDEWPAGWLSSYGSSCPESFLRDQSMGYVFVAHGLSAKAAKEQSALVLFCPADSHQRSEQHCHAVLADGLRCLKSNAEMVQLLRRELGRARAGSVPYSTNAQALMERELATRDKHARKREALRSGPLPSVPDSRQGTVGGNLRVCGGRFEPEIRKALRHTARHEVLRKTPWPGHSGFGFLSDFGFRASELGLNLSCH
jgi:hypothetical protein